MALLMWPWSWGLVGLGLLLLGLIPTYILSLRRAYKASKPEDLWPFTFLTLMVVSNMTETVLMTRTSPYWVMYMVIFLSLRLWPKRTGREVSGVFAGASVSSTA